MDVSYITVGKDDIFFKQSYMKSLQAFSLGGVGKTLAQQSQIPLFTIFSVTTICKVVKELWVNM